jgi:excisionase family DNA binding protein
MNNEQEFFTVKEISAKLGLPTQTIYCWIRRNQLNAIKLHSRVLIHRDTFAQMIADAQKGKR